MTIYYSPSTLGFYDTEIVEYPTLPDDVVEMSAEERSFYIDEINNKGNQLLLVEGVLTLAKPEAIITWETIRLDRNSLLNASDYTQIPDFPGDKEAWATYRQELRDVPQQFSDPKDVVWPTKPNN
jgi:hypothetical protein